jgi:SAM-dependent methyltransferase
MSASVPPHSAQRRRRRSRAADVRHNGRVDVAGLTALLTPEGALLLDRLAGEQDTDSLSLAVALRRDHPADLVAAALTQTRLRAQAESKFGAAAARMYFTPAGLEQATHAEVAALRARRFARAGARRVADLCCGVGGDLLALAAVGAEVSGIDRDPLSCAMAAANARAAGLSDLVTVRQEDVRTADLAGHDAAFCDPARRTATGRVFDPGGYSPPFDFLLELAGRQDRTGVKVAPGIPHELVPAGVEAEWVSYRGEVKEAALWFGELAGVDRRATLLPGGDTLVRVETDPAPVGPVERYLYEPDGAVIRAHLVAEVAAATGSHLLDPTIAYLTGQTRTRTPFATGYEVTDVLPFSLKRLRALLRQREVGRLTVKKRGSALRPETLRQQLKLRGSQEATIVLTRVAGAPTVLLVRPLD